MKRKLRVYKVKDKWVCQFGYVRAYWSTWELAIKDALGWATIPQVR